MQIISIRQKVFRLLHPFQFIFGGYVVCGSFFCHALTSTPSLVCSYSYSQQSILVNGHSTSVEYYKPDRPGASPLVFMLHGSAGAFSLKSANEPLVDNFGEKKLARNCFAVVLPHYLEALGYKSITSMQEATLHFPEILAAVDSLLTNAETLPWVKGQPVLLFGESLGGYLSIALGLRHSEVRAVSEISGGIPMGYAVDAPHRVAMLISHGVNDTLVPVQNAEDLKQYCLSHHLKVEMNLYPGAGHYLPQTVEAKCIATTVEFFLNQLHDG